MSEEALQIAEKRREVRGKETKERCDTHLNVEFQRIARREKKAFLSEQCKVEANRRLGKARNLLKKTRDSKATFYAEMDTMKERNCVYLTETEDIKRWQEYTEELHIKGLHEPNNHYGVITHLEPDILLCKVNWALMNRVVQVIEL